MFYFFEIKKGLRPTFQKVERSPLPLGFCGRNIPLRISRYIVFLHSRSSGSRISPPLQAFPLRFAPNSDHSRRNQVQVQSPDTAAGPPRISTVFLNALKKTYVNIRSRLIIHNNPNCHSSPPSASLSELHDMKRPSISSSTKVMGSSGATLRQTLRHKETRVR